MGTDPDEEEEKSAEQIALEAARRQAWDEADAEVDPDDEEKTARQKADQEDMADEWYREQLEDHLRIEKMKRDGTIDPQYDPENDEPL